MNGKNTHTYEKQTKRVTIIDGKEYTIENCYYCPFYNGKDDLIFTWDRCQYPEGPSRHASEYADNPPEDCPLKEEPNKADKERYLMEATRLPKCVSRELDMSNAPDWLKAKFKKATQ